MPYRTYKTINLFIGSGVKDERFKVGEVIEFLALLDPDPSRFGASNGVSSSSNFASPILRVTGKVGKIYVGF